MAKETDRIEEEIIRAREQLESTLDQLTQRANPKALADNAKSSAVTQLRKPAVQAAIAGTVSLVGLLVYSKIKKGKREKKILNALADGSLTF